MSGGMKNSFKKPNRWVAKMDKYDHKQVTTATHQKTSQNEVKAKAGEWSDTRNKGEAFHQSIFFKVDVKNTLIGIAWKVKHGSPRNI